MEGLKLLCKTWRIRYGLMSCFFFCILIGCSEKSFVSQALDYEERGDYEKAIAYWDKAIGRNPQKALYYISRGADKAELKDYNGAMKDYDLAIGIDSFLICGYMNRAGIKYCIKDFEGALKDYNNALNIYLFKTEHLQIKFVPLPRRLPFGNMVVNNDNLIEEPKYTIDDIRIYRAQIYYLMDSFNLALNDFTFCIDRKFCLPYCYYWRACVYHKLGDKEASNNDLRQVLRYADTGSEIAVCAQNALDKGLEILDIYDNME